MDGSFGALLRNHRLAAGLTQEALAEKAAISGQAVGALERGDRRFPHRHTVIRLADALGLTGTQHAEFTAAAVRRSTPRPVPVAALENKARPRQLPAATADFVGRVADGKTMLELLGSSSTVVVSAISGMAGVGKTAFALHWAHEIRDRFPDGQLYVNLRGFDPRRSPMSPVAAIRTFLEALDVAPQRIPASPEAQLGLYRSLLADREMLILLDNAVDAEQVRPLLPGTQGNLVLITSRNQLAGLAATDSAHLITLDLLSADESYELLYSRLGTERVAAEPDAAEEITIRCGRLPLALAIVAARAAAQPRMSLAALAAELREAQGSLEAFRSDDAAIDVRTVFSCSYHALNPQAAQVFRLLGLHPGPDVSVPAAASLAGLPPQQVRALLTELARANLIIEHSPGRYTFHDLLRAYAAEQAHTGEPDTARQAATHRMLDHYLHTARAAELLLAPDREQITTAAHQPGTTPEDLTDHRQALEWFTAEFSVLLAALDHAAGTGWNTHTWQLAWAFNSFSMRQGHWQDYIACLHAAVSAARRLDDAEAQGRMRRLLATVYSQMGDHDQANAQLELALDLAIGFEDVASQAHIHYHLCYVLTEQGDHQRALHHSRQALSRYQATGDRAYQAKALTAIGWNHSQLGNYHEALACCEQAHTLHQELGNDYLLGSTWDSLGYAHHHLGHYEQAITCYQHAFDISQAFGDRYHEALALQHLGDTHHAAGGLGEARDCWQRALQIFTDLEAPIADETRDRLRRLGA